MLQLTLKRVVPTVAAIAVVAATSSLGMWQLRRAEEREAMAALEEASATKAPIVLGGEKLQGAELLSLHPLVTRGEWRADKMVFLDNQIHKGRVGFHVVMPLRINGSDMYLLVDRGWTASTGNRSQLPEVATPRGTVEVNGIARQAGLRFKELDANFHEGLIWENVTVDRFVAWSGLRLQPVILQQTDVVADGLIRDWPKAGSGSEKNRGYALQWFAMAALTIGLWGYHFFRGKRSDEHSN
jgi:surfeit locus 1 family protein